jgi:hypothetical protein
MTTKPPKRVWPDESARKRDEERTRRFYLDRGMAPEKVEELLREREASWHRFRIIAEERERTKAEYGVFFAEVQAIVTRHDPIGVIFEDAPEAAETEYQVEAGTIIPHRSRRGRLSRNCGEHTLSMMCDASLMASSIVGSEWERPMIHGKSRACEPLRVRFGTHGIVSSRSSVR